MPVTDSMVDVPVIADWLRAAAPALIVIEYPMWVRHDGAQQASISWQNFGRVDGACMFTLPHTPIRRVEPRLWKADMGITLGHNASRTQKKAHAMNLARKLFGEEPWLKLVKHTDRGEALLMTYWGFMNQSVDSKGKLAYTPLR
jgi:hypothetical protein